MKHGIPEKLFKTTCTAGVGTLLLEFGTLSRLLGDPTYEITAKNALEGIWKFRSKKTGLLGRQLCYYSSNTYNTSILLLPDAQVNKGN